MGELSMFINNEVVKLNQKTSLILTKILIDVSYVLRSTIRIRKKLNFLSCSYKNFLCSESEKLNKKKTFDSYQDLMSYSYIKYLKRNNARLL